MVKRVIHTTADFEYAETLVFTEHAVSLGAQALSQGVPIITDTNMAKAGVSKPGLEKLGSQVACFMADPEIARQAQAQGTTRQWPPWPGPPRTIRGHFGCGQRPHGPV